MAEARKTLGIAIASVVFGCLFIIPILGIFFNLLAVIFGIIALHKIKKDPDQFGGYGTAITGTVMGTMGLIIAMVIGLMIFFSVPKFAKLKNQVECGVGALKIQTAITEYIKSKGEIPESLYDQEFLKFMKEGKLPTHTENRNWNDYYRDGELNPDACTFYKFDFHKKQ